MLMMAWQGGTGDVVFGEQTSWRYCSVLSVWRARRGLSEAAAAVAKAARARLYFMIVGFCFLCAIGVKIAAKKKSRNSIAET
jgi:hypothetical protein